MTSRRIKGPPSSVTCHLINANWNGLLIDLLDMIWSHLSLQEQLTTIALVCRRWNHGNKHGFGWGDTLLDVQQLTNKRHHSMSFALLYSRFHHIESLTIPGSLLTRDIMIAIHQLSRLRILRIDDLNVASIDTISSLPSLTALDVDYQLIACADEHWRAIHTLPYLRSLVITGTHRCENPLVLGALITQLTFGLRPSVGYYIIMDHTWNQLRSLELRAGWFHNGKKNLSFGGNLSGNKLLSSLTTIRLGTMEGVHDLLVANCVPSHLHSLIMDGPTINMTRDLATFRIRPTELNLSQPMQWISHLICDDADTNSYYSSETEQGRLNQQFAIIRSLLLLIPLTYNDRSDDNNNKTDNLTSSSNLTKLSLHLYQFSNHLAMLLPLFRRMSFLSLHDCDKQALNWFISHLTHSSRWGLKGVSLSSSSLPLLNGCYIGAVYMETGEMSIPVKQTFSRREMINGDMMIAITKRFHLLTLSKTAKKLGEDEEYICLPLLPNVDWQCMISPACTYDKQQSQVYNTTIMHALFNFFGHEIVKYTLERVCRTWLHASTMNGCGWKRCRLPFMKELTWIKQLSTTRLSRVRRIILHSSNWKPGIHLSLSIINHYLPWLIYLDLTDTPLIASRLAPLSDCKRLAILRINASFADKVPINSRTMIDDQHNINNEWVWHELPPVLRSLALKCSNQYRTPDLPLQLSWTQLLSLELSGWWQSNSLDNNLYRSMSLTQVIS
jgi:hypothetical protein